MISRLANIISEALLKEQVIKEAERELYVYGLFLLISQGLFFLLSVFFGFLFGQVWENAVFYIIFSILRGYAGGFHASKESVCAVCTTIALLLSAILIFALERVTGAFISFVLIFLGGIIIFRISPLDSEGKPLNEVERAEYKNKSIEVYAIIVLASLLGTACHIFGVLYAAATSIALEGVLLLIGKRKRNAQICNSV